MNPNQPSPPIQPLPAQSATLPMEADARVIIHCPNGITVHVYRNCDNLATIIDTYHEGQGECVATECLADEDFEDEEPDEEEKELVAFDDSDEPTAWVELVRRNYDGYSSKEAFRAAEHLYNKRRGVLPGEHEDWANA